MPVILTFAGREDVLARSGAGVRLMASDDWYIEIHDSASDADTAELRAALHEYNFATTGYRDGRDLACFVRDNGRLVAGISGFTWGGYARVDLLWIDEPMRGHGLGRALLSAAEDEARRRGCRIIVLDTHSFQAPGFYSGLGYTKVGETVDAPIGFTSATFQKRLETRRDDAGECH